MNIWQKIVLFIGALLILLRLFIPVEESIVPTTKWEYIERDYHKNVNKTKTTFQCIGISIMTGALIIILHKKQNNK